MIRFIRLLIILIKEFILYLKDFKLYLYKKIQLEEVDLQSKIIFGEKNERDTKNKQIIIEELRRLLTFHGYNIPEHDYKAFAEEVLQKLQTLNKGKVEKIILQTSAIEELELKNGAKVTYRVIGQAGFGIMINELCSLLPEWVRK